MKTHVCGCVTTIDPDWGIQRAVTKCAGHREALRDQPTGYDYYRTLGVFDEGGNWRTDVYESELLDGIGEVPPAPKGGGLAVEVGGGCSLYVPLLRKAGYQYVGFEPDAFGANWTKDTHHVHVENRPFLPTVLDEHGGQPRGSTHLILCAHAVEHVADAPAMLRSFFELLAPGRPLVLVIPDDTDPLNPDHWWFFNESSLRATLTRLGFVDVRIETRKRIARENFLYCVAWKP